MLVSHEKMLEHNEQIREWAGAVYEDDPVLRSIATISSLDAIINIIKSHPEREIHLPTPRFAYMLDAMNVYRSILSNGGEYRGYRFDLYEYSDWDVPLTWDEAQHMMKDPDYKGYPVFRLHMHDDTERVSLYWPIPFTMLAPHPYTYTA